MLFKHTRDVIDSTFRPNQTALKSVQFGYKKKHEPISSLLIGYAIFSSPLHKYYTAENFMLHFVIFFISDITFYCYKNHYIYKK